jgi:hypothetical protein
MDITYDGAKLEDVVPCFEDSFHVPNFVQNELNMDPNHLFRVLRETAPWTDPADDNWKYRGNELARQKFVLVRMDATQIPVYSYPGWQYASVLDYRPFQTVPEIDSIMAKLQLICINGVPLSINHVIGTHYRDAHDNIGYHHDKVKDFALWQAGSEKLQENHL